jgi:hypothetical protein
VNRSEPARCQAGAPPSPARARCRATQARRSRVVGFSHERECTRGIYKGDVRRAGFSACSVAVAGCVPGLGFLTSRRPDHDHDHCSWWPSFDTLDSNAWGGQTRIASACGDDLAACWVPDPPMSPRVARINGALGFARTSGPAPCTPGDGLGTPATGQASASSAPRRAAKRPFRHTAGARLPSRTRWRTSFTRNEVEAALRRCARRADGLDALREALGGEQALKFFAIEDRSQVPHALAALLKKRRQASTSSPRPCFISSQRVAFLGRA